MSYFHAMEGNIEAFLENNPGLSLEQVKGVFDSAVISADNDWGFGKNEFRYEGRGSDYAGLYGAEAVVMNEGMITGVFTRASTLPDKGYEGGTIAEGIYDYSFGKHPMTRGRRTPSEPSADATQETYLGAYYDALNIYDRTLPTNNPNSNHGGQYIMTGANSHAGFVFVSGTGSHGCPVMYYEDYYDYITLFGPGDKGKFSIIR